ASPSFNIPMICSSLNLFFFICPPFYTQRTLFSTGPVYRGQVNPVFTYGGAEGSLFSQIIQLLETNKNELKDLKDSLVEKIRAKMGG
ncbi:MAG: hypothetical protein ACOY3I_04910, partial [Verrucomicrobiota bacterium]